LVTTPAVHFGYWKTYSNLTPPMARDHMVVRYIGAQIQAGQIRYTEEFDLMNSKSSCISQ